MYNKVVAGVICTSNNNNNDNNNDNQDDDKSQFDIDNVNLTLILTSTCTIKGKVIKKRKTSLVTETKQLVPIQNYKAWLIHRDDIHTKLIQNLVIQTLKDGYSVTKSKEASIENSTLVPKIPTLPEF